MQNVLVVIDMQNDFVTDALGTKEAVQIVPGVAQRIEKGIEQGEIIFFTRDTHEENYMNTQEGRKLPVPHCIRETKGWEIVEPIRKYAKDCQIIDKPSFGSLVLAEKLRKLDETDPIGQITLVGLCTDICVISNALLIKSCLPEVEIAVEMSCCAGVTPESHENALQAMRMCQIAVV